MDVTPFVEHGIWPARVSARRTGRSDHVGWDPRRGRSLGCSCGGSRSSSRPVGDTWPWYLAGRRTSFKKKTWSASNYLYLDDDVAYPQPAQRFQGQRLAFLQVQSEFPVIASVAPLNIYEFHLTQATTDCPAQLCRANGGQTA